MKMDFVVIILWIVSSLISVNCSMHQYSTCVTVYRDSHEKHVDCAAEDSEIPKLLLRVSEDKEITQLRLYINSAKDNVLDVSNIKYISNLTNFSLLADGNYDYFHSSKLHFDEDTFSNMKIRHLHLNLPLKVCDLGKLVSRLENLNTLDISQTYELEMETVEQAFLMLHGKPSKIINLSQFQTPGNLKLSTAFNVAKMLSANKTILHELIELDISSCAINYIHAGFFDVFPNLQILDVSGNDLVYLTNLPVLLEMLMHPAVTKIKSLQLSSNKFTEQDKSLKQSQLSQDRNTREVHSLPGPGENKRPIFLMVNTFMECINNNSKHNVSNMFLQQSNFSKALKCIFPRFLRDLNNSIFPPLDKVFDFESSFMIRIPVGPNLHTLETSVSSKVLSGISTHSKHTNFNLKTVKNNITKVTVEIHGSFINNEDENNNNYYIIQGLDNVSHFKYNQFDSAISMELLMKYVVPNVQYLNVSGQYPSMSPTFGLCTGNHKCIKEVDISNGQLRTLPPNLIKNCKLLTQILIFNNYIEYLFLNLSGTENLQLIDLRNNQIQYIDGLFQQQLENIILINRQFKIDLRYNSLSCACDLKIKTFLEWSKHTTALFRKKSLECFGSQGISNLSWVFDDLESYNKACFPSHFTVIVVSIAVSLSTLAIFGLSILTYHKRWKIRYILFSIQQRLTQKSIMEGASSHSDSFKYDAFVSYCSEDRFWVHGTLMTMLENFYKFHLCIHYRDFPLGEFISDAIIQKVEQSRELILVISDRYLHPSREWCRFETEVLRLCSLRRNKPLIVITLGNILRENLDLNITNLLDTQVVLPWPEDKGGHPLFWAKLVDEMYHHGRSWCCVRTDNARNIGPEVINNFADDGDDSERTPLIRLV